jgi:CBS domain containing-hemolysin-like protein
MGAQHSRFPVLDDADQIVGVVHLEDVLSAAPGGLDAEVRELVRPAVVVPTLMALPDAVRELSASRNQLACVVDEFGGFAGILTMEDLAEELVGEITDEHDPAHPDQPVRDDDGVWVMGGDVHVDEVERAIDHDLPRGDYETIAGLAIARFGELPEPGATIEVELDPDPADLVHEEDLAPLRILIEVLEVERHVPSLVRLSVAERPATTTEVTR